ncbi:MAG: alpha/beta hydrolase family protein [Verrucomicrobiia bacterium]
MRSRLLQLIPARHPVPPRSKILEGVITDYGIRELIEYTVAPGERVRAWLLTPRARGRLPGVLASHQHNGQYWLGKSEPAGLSKNTMYHYGIDLCRQGYVVLCPDHLGFEERAPREIDRIEGTRPANREYEAFLFADQILRGSSLAAKYLFDMCQGLDVLESHGRVRPDRMGVLGHSLGGQTTLWHAFYDERVRVAFSSCGFSTLAAVQKHCIPHNFAAYLPNLLNVGDLDDVVAAISPRAFGMSNGTQDSIFPMEGVRQIHRKARRAFPRGKFLAIAFEGPHQFPDSVKRQAYAFLKRHLKT